MSLLYWKAAYNMNYKLFGRIVLWFINPAFTFRPFMLRLGLIGPEYKNVREHLLANLEGDRAWRYGHSTYECLNRNHRAEDVR